MKKKLLILIPIFAIIILVLLYLKTPKPIFKEVSKLQISSVIEYDINNGEQDITSQMDLEKLKILLSEYKCKRLKRPFSPYFQKDVFYNIHGIYNNESVHIILGNINIVYESADEGGNKIINYQDLLDEINQLKK